MLAFLNRCASRPGSAARRAAQDVVQTVHAVLSGGLHRLPDHVSDPQNFNIAQNDMISTYGLSMTQLGMIGRLLHHLRRGETVVSYYADGKTPSNSCRLC